MNDDLFNRMTPEDRVEYLRLTEAIEYNDRLQYIYKIKLNSLYGALSNLYFRFYDLRMGESTTATGRAILKHQCRMVSKALGGEYDIDFPLWGTEEECIEHGVDPIWALHGRRFNGTYPSEHVIYGDTDSVDASTLVDIDGVTDTIENHFHALADTAQVITTPNNVELLMLHGMVDSPCISDEGWDYAPVNLIYRHKTSKRRFKVTTSSGREVIVTEDHSLMRISSDNRLESCTPLELMVGDRVIEQK